MKTKIVFITRCLIVVISIFGLCLQTYAQFNYGVNSGIGFHNLNRKNSYGETIGGHTLLPSIRVGVFAEVNLLRGVYVQPSFLFATKGSNYEPTAVGFKANSIKSESINIRTKLSYLELDFNFIYKANLSAGSAFVGAGPYIGLGLGGSETLIKGAYETKFHVTFASQWHIGETAGTTLKAVDYGLNALAGYSFDSGLIIGINGQLGLANLYVRRLIPIKSDICNQSSTNNVGFSLIVGYQF
jgi:hypothetical protein